MFVEVDVPIRVSLRALATAVDKKGFIETIAEETKQRVIKQLTEFDIEKELKKDRERLIEAARRGFKS